MYIYQHIFDMYMSIHIYIPRHQNRNSIKWRYIYYSISKNNVMFNLAVIIIWLSIQHHQTLSYVLDCLQHQTTV